MELTFVHQYSDLPSKRRRLAIGSACDACRRRKKRCLHFAGDNSSAPTRNDSSASTEGEDVVRDNAPSSDTFVTSTTGAAYSDEANERSCARPNEPEIRTTSGTPHAKFFSDLRPESTLLERGPRQLDTEQHRLSEDIGIWVDRREWNELVRQKNDAANAPPRTTTTAAAAGDVAHGGAKPRSTIIGPLVDVYFEKSHPILPLVEEEEYRRAFAEGSAPEAMTLAMCLVAAKDKSAEPYLQLTKSTSTVSVRQFCGSLHAIVAASLRLPLRVDKTTLIRILALMSLHVDGADGAEESSLYLTQAMHYAQTLGIHLGQQNGSLGAKDLQLKRLFWCLWTLDRTSSAINGRPIVIADIDIAIAPVRPGESGFPAFEVWLQITDMLNKVIDFYRPRIDNGLKGWEGEFTPLESIIDSVNGWKLPASMLATFHLYFLAVGILSHRTRGTNDLPGGSASYIRQRLFAIEIIRLMNVPSSDQIHPLPIVPHAVSLALSVSYQHLRQSQFEHQQLDALEDFRTCCQLLQNLRRTWSTADVMASLAKKVLDEIDKLPDLAAFRLRRVKDAHARSAEGRDLQVSPPSACRYDNDATNASRLPDVSERADVVAGMAPQAIQPQMFRAESSSYFDNLDDVFGTFMHPNYPLNLDDMPFVDDLHSWEWHEAAGST